MKQYEVMYIIDTALEDQARNDLIARFSGLVEANGGQVDRVDEWGKRRLAYAIEDRTEGYYVLMYVKAPPELPRELERNFKISDSVLRYMTIRFEGALPPKREPLRPYSPAPAIANEAAAQRVGESDAEGGEPAPDASADDAPIVDGAPAEAPPAGEPEAEAEAEVESAESPAED